MNQVCFYYYGCVIESSAAAAVETDRLVVLAGFQGVREGVQGRRPAFSGACGDSWWNSTSERAKHNQTFLCSGVLGPRTPPSHP